MKQNTFTKSTVEQQSCTQHLFCFDAALNSQRWMDKLLITAAKYFDLPHAKQKSIFLADSFSFLTCFSK